MGEIFQTRRPAITGNPHLRTPQIEAYESICEFLDGDNFEREIGVVLPVGCGKSGVITITPFAFRANRVLVVAPGINIAEQLGNDFDPSNPDMFYKKCWILDSAPYPEPVPIRGTSTNRADLEDAEVVITNIQQLQRENNRWRGTLPQDFFDLILFDEAHHNVAASWEALRQAFPEARVVNYSATPVRADGQLMAGRIIYSYPVARAIQEGYVKRLKALVLNPTTLRYVRREDEREVEVDLEEVKRLGEVDASFRRSIVTSQETLNTIVDASIRALLNLRRETTDQRHKIIASALNYEHCIQVVQAYRARGLRAEYVHSREDSITNQRILQQLHNHEIDVIVQVRKLGEGFDHPYLSVAAVFSIFRELAPFVQFVGRIMRVIERDNPNSTLNQGIVVFHSGANIARVWSDFQAFSQADQDYFDQLLPLEGLDFNDANEILLEPDINAPGRRARAVEIRQQNQVLVEEIPLLDNDEEARRAFEILRSRGFTPDEYRRAYEHEPIAAPRFRERQAARRALSDRVQNVTGQILARRNINPQGRSLDTRRIGHNNFQVVKAAIDRKINGLVGHGTGERSEFSRAELDSIDREFERLVLEVEEEIFNA
ncbi:DEAD/DEAH box helicase [Desulfotruncus alcoholivorax]|uniref:DEAD/DEAH box helicase n=1 Tax=Desulfotruncus alcoholivorax TaxID=265477 RepID=UPI0004252914|nr:DEAD/DEAH box helicase family protein [Desulfotruncus alcoholivorax]